MANRNKLSNQTLTKSSLSTTLSRVGGAVALLSIILMGIFMTQEATKMEAEQVENEFTASAIENSLESSTIEANVKELGQTAIVEQEVIEEQLEEVALAEMKTTTATRATAIKTQRKQTQTATLKNQSVTQALKTSSAVQFSNMTATVESNAGKLVWSTLMERNSKHFEIERSLDDEGYTSLGKVSGAGLGQTNQEKKYEYFDETLKDVLMPRVFYRIKQVGVDGKIHTSEPIEYQLGLDIGLYAKIESMETNKMTVRYAADVSDSMKIRILAPSGTIVEEQSLWGEFDPQLTEFNTEKLAAGTYYLQLKSEGNSFMEPFVLAK